MSADLVLTAAYALVVGVSVGAVGVAVAHRRREWRISEALRDPDTGAGALTVPTVDGGDVTAVNAGGGVVVMMITRRHRALAAVAVSAAAARRLGTVLDEQGAHALASDRKATDLD